MTKWILMAAFIVSALPLPAMAQSKDDLVGTWKLVRGWYILARK
jgi:hypothetical protein